MSNLDLDGKAKSSVKVHYPHGQPSRQVTTKKSRFKNKKMSKNPLRKFQEFQPQLKVLYLVHSH